MIDPYQSSVYWLRDALKVAPVLAFRVRGSPAPGGSKFSFVPKNRRTGEPLRRKNGSIMVTTIDDANRRTADGRQPNKEWRAAVASAAVESTQAARSQMAAAYRERSGILTGPLIVVATFILARPKGDFGSGRNAGQLKPTAATYHTKKPDALKLMRSTEDALTGVIWLDDAQIVASIPIKRYARPGEPTGAEIEVFKL